MERNKYKCFLWELWYNIVYIQDGLMQGLVLSGHDLEFTGDVGDDHWCMVCKRCGKQAGSEIAPDRMRDEEDIR